MATEKIERMREQIKNLTPRTHMMLKYELQAELAIECGMSKQEAHDFYYSNLPLDKWKRFMMRGR